MYSKKLSCARALFSFHQHVQRQLPARSFAATHHAVVTWFFGRETRGWSGKKGPKRGGCGCSAIIWSFICNFTIIQVVMQEKESKRIQLKTSLYTILHMLSNLMFFCKTKALSRHNNSNAQTPSGWWRCSEFQLCGRTPADAAPKANSRPPGTAGGWAVGFGGTRSSMSSAKCHQNKVLEFIKPPRIVGKFIILNMKNGGKHLILIMLKHSIA